MISLDEIERRGKRMTSWDNVVGYKIVAQTCNSLLGTTELIVEKDGNEYKITAGFCRLKINELEEEG